MTLSTPSAGKKPPANIAGMIAKYLATSFGIENVVSKPRVISNCLPITDDLDQAWSGRSRGRPCCRPGSPRSCRCSWRPRHPLEPVPTRRSRRPPAVRRGPRPGRPRHRVRRPVCAGVRGPVPRGPGTAGPAGRPPLPAAARPRRAGRVVRRSAPPTCARGSGCPAPPAPAQPGPRPPGWLPPPDGNAARPGRTARRARVTRRARAGSRPAPRWRRRVRGRRPAPAGSRAGVLVPEARGGLPRRQQRVLQRVRPACGPAASRCAATRADAPGRAWSARRRTG